MINAHLSGYTFCFVLFVFFFWKVNIGENKKFKHKNKSKTPTKFSLQPQSNQSLWNRNFGTKVRQKKNSNTKTNQNLQPNSLCSLKVLKFFGQYFSLVACERTPNKSDPHGCTPFDTLPTLHSKFSPDKLDPHCCTTFNIPPTLHSKFHYIIFFQERGVSKDDLKWRRIHPKKTKKNGVEFICGKMVLYVNFFSGSDIHTETE